MNRKELHKRARKGLAYVLRLVVNRKIENSEIKEELMGVNSVVYEIYEHLSEQDISFEKDLRFCVNAAKYVRGEYSPTFPYFQAKGIDELLGDERCEREFSVVDVVFDDAIERIGGTVLGQVDDYDENGVMTNLKITAKGRLNDLRMRERCRIRAGHRRYINTNEDIKRVLRETYKNSEKEINESSDPETVARARELKKQYEVLLESLNRV